MSRSQSNQQYSMTKIMLIFSLGNDERQYFTSIFWGYFRNRNPSNYPVNPYLFSLPYWRVHSEHTDQLSIRGCVEEKFPCSNVRVRATEIILTWPVRSILLNVSASNTELTMLGRGLYSARMKRIAESTLRICAVVESVRKTRNTTSTINCDSKNCYFF